MGTGMMCNACVDSLWSQGINPGSFFESSSEIYFPPQQGTLLELELTGDVGEYERANYRHFAEVVRLGAQAGEEPHVASFHETSRAQIAGDVRGGKPCTLRGVCPLFRSLRSTT